MSLFPSCAAVKIRCRSRRTLSSWCRQSTASHERATSSGPFTIGCLTCPSVPATWGTAPLHRLTCPRQHPFRGRAPGPVSSQLSSNDGLKEPFKVVLVSCRLSPAGIRFLDILFPPENSALLTVGLPIRHQDGPDSVGVPMFRTHEMRPGWVPPVPRGRRCPPDRRSLSDRRLPLPNGQPYTPLKPPTGGAADNGAYEDSLAFTRPVFPSPVAPGWNGNPSASSPGFAPHSHP